MTVTWTDSATMKKMPNVALSVGKVTNFYHAPPIRKRNARDRGSGGLKERK